MWKVKTTPIAPQTIEVEKIVKKYVDVNYEDIDEKKFVQELYRLWSSYAGDSGYSSPWSIINWFADLMRDGTIAMLVEECTFIPHEYVSMEASVRENKGT